MQLAPQQQANSSARFQRRAPRNRWPMLCVARELIGGEHGQVARRRGPAGRAGAGAGPAEQAAGRAHRHSREPGARSERARQEVDTCHFLVHEPLRCSSGAPLGGAPKVPSARAAPSPPPLEPANSSAPPPSWEVPSERS